MIKIVIVKLSTLYHIERKGVTIFDIAVRFLSLLRLETVSLPLTLVKNGNNIFTKLHVDTQIVHEGMQAAKDQNSSSNKQTTPQLEDNVSFL